MNIVMVVAQQGFRDEELFEPKAILESHGHSVQVASTQRGEATGKLGGITQVDLSLPEIEASAFDAIVFVGGPGCKQFFHDEIAHHIIQEFDQQKKVVASICSAGGTLAYSGILKGKKATSFPTERQDLEKCGADYQEHPVVTDGRIVTANGPQAAKAFGEAIANLLA